MRSIAKRDARLVDQLQVRFVNETRRGQCHALLAQLEVTMGDRSQVVVHLRHELVEDSSTTAVQVTARVRPVRGGHWLEEAIGQAHRRARGARCRVAERFLVYVTEKVSPGSAQT
jgi:hypothetical protein